MAGLQRGQVDHRRVVAVSGPNPPQHRSRQRQRALVQQSKFQV